MHSAQPSRAAHFYGLLCSILGFLVTVLSYFVPFGISKCNEVSVCGFGPSLVSEIMHTLSNAPISMLVFFPPVIFATLFIIFGLYYFFHPRRFFWWILGIWIVTCIYDFLFMWFHLLLEYPSFGFWGILVGDMFFICAFLLYAVQAKDS